MKKLEGRVAIVTGASSGVGRGLAKVLAENGAKICACVIPSGMVTVATIRLPELLPMLVISAR